MIEFKTEVSSTITIPQEKVAAALEALNKHFETTWPNLAAALADHSIRASFCGVTGDLLIGSYTCAPEDGPRDEEVEDMVALLGPFVRDGGEIEVTTDDFNDDGYVVQHSVGPYRFRNGKVYEIRTEVTTREVELG